MSAQNSRLQAIVWTRPTLTILNQLVLPHSSEYIPIPDSAAGHHAIVTMQTRGAPAIAIVAALSLAAELGARTFATNAEAQSFIHEKLDYLSTSRPTAVNLFDAVTKLKALVSGSENAAEDYVDAAEQMLRDDIADNTAIGKNGAAFIEARRPTGMQAIKVLTHCNTGALATAGHGTALGIVRSLYQKPAGRVLEHVYFTETRPYNQGARLTAYELQEEGIPSTLVCDSAVSALLRSDPTIRAIVVGADRVARNGDTANKIGTYQLAITAKFHGVDFIVAAPVTSIDLALESGKEIVIEERAMQEITQTAGFASESIGESELVRQTVQVAPVGTRAWNPSFDVTPAELITAVVTEKGVFEKKNGRGVFDLAADIANA
ncbi:S-methyl-5-thioribose-1-phosphate isomerase [Linderina macrospora]|uniref:S-methyl-5-thioribose-1-phosphate isomerase n=1 Tax=Linderina macrospora TaxID=4868 RepID=A0ACC1JCC1_9FUNG|nr:S-methyl-5-thioribose-1-phosphate isomerase [Linderina macrospora]